MKKTGAMVTVAAVITMVFTAIWAEQQSEENYRLGGYGWFEAGQLVEGIDRNGPFGKKWVEGFGLGLNVDASVGDRLGVHIGGECVTTFSHTLDITMIDFYRETQYPRFSFLPTRAEGVVRISGSFDSPALQLGIGYFPYKYNPQVRNLGEFLFRSGTYPVYLLNQFDLPYARLLGFRLSSDLPLGSRFSYRQDLMLTSEVAKFPQKDFSLSYLGSLSMHRVMEIGGGVCLSNLLSVDESITSPYANGQNMLRDSSGNYTFGGTKLMGRVTLDPKRLLNFSVFGEEDLKLYAECAVIGLRDYPVYYEELRERIPLLLGFNAPGFRIFDVIALEAEYWPSRYPNSYEKVYYSIVPQPFDDEFSPVYPHEEWKWSVYVARTILKGFAVTGQVARDHIQPVTHSLLKQDRTDVLQTNRHWWWVLKAKFSF